MARDIRELFKDDKMAYEKMPENHQERFLYQNSKGRYQKLL